MRDTRQLICLSLEVIPPTVLIGVHLRTPRSSTRRRPKPLSSSTGPPKLGELMPSQVASELWTPTPLKRPQSVAYAEHGTCTAWTTVQRLWMKAASTIDLFSQTAPWKGVYPNRERMMKPPFDHQFIEWTIGDEQGDIVPFRLPSHPSLEAVSVSLMMWRGEDVPAEIVFLGSDCLQFRALRSVLFSKEPGKPGEMMVFAGLRRTETEIAREKAQVREHNRRDSSPRCFFGELYV